MSYLIQIAHPNDIIRGAWKDIEIVDSIQECEDHIASPDFEVYDGLCVKIIGNKEEVYEGIFNHGEYFNVSKGSDLWNDYNSSVYYPIDEKSGLLTIWADHDSGDVLMNHFYKAMNKEQMVKFHITLCREALNKASRRFNRFFDWLSVIENSYNAAHTDELYDEIFEVLYRLSNEDEVARFLCESILYICSYRSTKLLDNGFVAINRIAFTSNNSEAMLKQIADRIRTEFQFMPIALAMTRKP